MPQHKYPIEIAYSEEDGGYIANVPDLRYCSAFGETYEEALREVLGAMEVHLDTLRDLNRPVPAPGSRRGVGVSALVLESGQTIELQEEATGGFPGASWLSGEGEVATVRDLGGTVSGGAEGIVGAEEAIEGIVESAGEAIDVIAESAAGAIEGIVAAGTGEVSEGTDPGHGEDEPGPQEGGQPSRRPGRRSDP